MRNWKTRIFHLAYYRVTHARKFPKGDLVSFLRNLARRGFEPTHVVDVGANQGKWSRKFRRVFPDCHFTLVEPQIEMKPHLDKFCRHSQGSRWINAGVGAALGQLPLTIVPDTVSSSFTIAEDEARRSQYERRTVPIVTLDHVVANVVGVVPEVVKIDARGFECQIMQGAGTLIDRTELFLLETPLIDPPPGWHSFLEIVSMMRDYGYLPYDFTTFQRRPWDGALGLCEMVFARQNGWLRSFGGWDKPVAPAA